MLLRAFQFILLLFIGFSMTYHASSTHAQQALRHNVSEDFSDVIVAPNTVTTTLDNGMEVVIVPDNRAPVVTHMVWYKVGAADEPKGKSGIAHFLEHLMFKGTKNYPDGAFSKKVSEIGGQENAFTSWDYTAYYQRVSKEHLPLVMRMEADRMSNLVLTDEKVLPERDVVLEERAQRIENDPSSRLSEELASALFSHHPYGTPIIGWKHEIEKLSRQDAIDFYNQFYTPKNAILVIAGDVEPDNAIALAEDIYGAIEQRSDIEDRFRPQEPPSYSERRVILKDERVQQPSLQINFIVPTYASDETGKQAPALDVLTTILGHGNTSRLYQDLVAHDGIAAYAGAYYRSDGLNDTQLTFYGLPKDVNQIDEVEKALKASVRKLIDEGVKPDELERAKRKLISSTLFAQDSQTTLARIMGTALATGETIQDVQTWPAAIAAVTAEDVKKVAEDFINFDRAVYGLLLPQSSNSDSPEKKEAVSDELSGQDEQAQDKP
jgi:zinc protease